MAGIIRECDNCGKEDSINPVTGLCSTCQIMTEMNKKISKHMR